MNYDPYTGEPIRSAPDPSQAAPAGETPSPEPEGATGSVRFRVPPEEQKTVLNYVWRRPILRTILFTVLALFANFVLLIVWAVNDGNAYLGIVLLILLPLAVLATGVAFLIYFASGKGRMRRELEVREYSYVFYADRLVCTMRDNGVPAASETVLLDGIERQEIEGNYRFLRRGRRVWFIRLAPNGAQPAPSSPSVNAAPEPAPAGETLAPTVGTENSDPCTGERLNPAAAREPSPEPEEPRRSVRFRVPSADVELIVGYATKPQTRKMLLCWVVLLVCCAIVAAVVFASGGRVIGGMAIAVAFIVTVFIIFYLVVSRKANKTAREAIRTREYAYDFYSDRFSLRIFENGEMTRSAVFRNTEVTKREQTDRYLLFWIGNGMYFIPNDGAPTPGATAGTTAPAATPAPTAANFDPYTGEPTRPAPDPSQAAPAGTDGAAATPAPVAPETDPTAPGAAPAGVRANRPKAPMVLLILSVLSLAVLQYLFVMGTAVAGFAGSPLPFLIPLLLLPLPVATVIVGARSRQKDKRYRNAMVGGTVVAAIVLVAALGAGGVGLLSGRAQRAEAAKANAVLDEYRSVVGFEVPKADFTNFRDDAAEDGYDDNHTLIRVQRYANFEFDNTETAEQLLAAAEASDLWLEPLPNSLRGVYAGSWAYGSDEEGVERRFLSMIYDPETGKFNTLPEQPGVYRYVSFELSVTRDTTGRRPTAYAHFSIRECVVNYVG